MAWLLFVLLLVVVWALWFVLSLFYELSIYLPIIASAVVVVVGVALFVFRRIRAARGANALEKAIAQQGTQQALNARPERRAEIQELQKQVQGGIAALKKSKLGGKSGGAALYSLPWYVIIGPPGAGKTTALKHSGLVFPYADPASGGGVRGVGGTRNCDWWFTNEAILLDTAGRYTTEQDDRDEWLSFLQMLLRYRSKQPLNGILVAISVAELIDANESQIEATGKKIRARIDEVMTQLHMVLPVYVLFTKCDLIAGFSEFFGDLRKSDRSQGWGATLKLDMPKADPGRIFDQEFDVLCKQVHARGLKRLAAERSREAREKLFQFPLEFAGIKRNLAELVSNVFAVNAFQGTPIFRGFYFTSGTQEGKPLDRVLGRMGQAMGIRPPEASAQAVVESKSYFLHDVFMNVVFPDANVAGRSQSQIRRQLLMRVAISGTAAMLAVIVAIPAVISWLNNRTFLKESEDRARVATTITWGDGQPATTKLDLLKPVHDRLEEIDKYGAEGVPLGMGMSMYQGDAVYRPLVRVFVHNMQQGFVIPCQAKLESRLRLVKGEKYLKERLDLKTYLMMSDVANLDIEWATGRLVNLWAEVLRPTTNIPEDELKRKLVGPVGYYLALLKKGTVQPVASNAELVDKTRKTLQAVPVTTRYYEQFVNSLIEEKYDEAGDTVRENLKYPPFTLSDMFADRPRALKVLESARYKKEKRWQEVEGPYTEKGHYAVLHNIIEGGELLQREAWVVPLTEDERLDKVKVHLSRLSDDYDQRYINQWTDWLLDVKVIKPSSMKDAIDTYGALIEPEWPYLRILRQVQDHTQWRHGKSIVENKGLMNEANRRANQKLTAATGGFRFNVDLSKVGEKTSAVPGQFKRTVEFGVPSGTPSGASETPLARYIGFLDGLRSEMIKIENPSSGIDPRTIQERLLDTAKQTDALFQPFDEKARTLLGPLLLDPLQILGAPKLATPGIGRYPGQTGAGRWPRR